MSILFGIGFDKSEGPDIQIDCPSCESRSVMAATWTEQETYKILLTPVYRRATTFVRCRQCQRRFTSALSIPDLFRRDPAAASEALRGYVSLVATTLAISALLLSCFPIFGLVMALLGYLTNRQVPGWRRSICLVGLIVSGLSTLFMLFVIATAP